MNRFAVIFTNPYEVILHEEPLPEIKEREVLIKTQWSAISPGTEMLVYHGLFPQGLSVDATLNVLSQTFRYPLKYGYSSVGRVAAVGSKVSPDWLNRRVFCFHPHESHYVAMPEQLIPIPADIDPIEALFLSNMESAVNFLMDGHPVIGEQAVVFGQGIVGLLTTALLAQFPLKSLITLDNFQMRRDRSLQVGAHRALDSKNSEDWNEITDILNVKSNRGGADLLYELSGNPQALNQAIDLAGFGARVVIGSWYGQKQTHLDLGAKFHRDRIRLISSQVSSLAPRYSGSWTKRRRLDTAWDMIRRIKPRRFITQRFQIKRVKEAFELLEKKPEETIQIVLEYERR